jgi:hypothetical protein
MVLPHLTDGPLDLPIARSEAAGLHGDWESPQISGTCYFRCVLSAVRVAT